MARNEIDDRIRVLIENSVITGHRSLFVIVGEKALDNVVILYEMLSKADDKSRPPVLWCYKNLDFSINKKKRQKLMEDESIEEKQADTEIQNAVDPLEHFITSTHIKYCSYSDTGSVVGRTCGMAILQDFEALTPNILARTVETVAGGGMIIIVLQTLKSLKQLYTMAMDVHAHYRTEVFQDVAYRFNERFVLSLPTCSDCLVVDDKLTILPISSNAASIKPLPKSEGSKNSCDEEKFLKLKKKLDPAEPVEELVKMCKTFDQGKAVSQFIDSLCEKSLHSTVVLSSARGRGKSAALGFAVAAAVDFRYCYIVIAAANPESARTVFEFAAKGLNKLGYKKYSDYDEVKSCDQAFSNSVVQIIVKKRQPHQVITYYELRYGKKLDKEIELVIIDEAASISFPFVQSMMGRCIVFMSSTINGFEASGRCHSLKLINQLRKQTASSDSSDQTSQKNYTGRVLHEILLNEPIRYHNEDQVEDWLNRLLCLDMTVPTLKLTKFPEASDCKLYYVNRDTLFSCTKSAEKFLHKLISILLASQYKNSPDELLVMADAPAHRIFCLCAPSSKELPEILCVLHVCYEGKLTESTVRKELIEERLKNHETIPWAIIQESTEEICTESAGVRIVQIATHPEYRKKGYGAHAVKLLQEFYKGKFMIDRSDVVNMTPVLVKDDDFESVANLLEEKVEKTTSLPPLLYELYQVKPKVIGYLVVSYEITLDLLRFWKKAGFCPAYFASFANQYGKHTCVMVKQLSGLAPSEWITKFWIDICLTLVNVDSLLTHQFSAEVALEMISDPSMPTLYKDLSKVQVYNFFKLPEVEVLRDVCYSDILQPPGSLVQRLSKFYFSRPFPDIRLEKNERIAFFGTGCMQQFFEVGRQLNMEPDQVDEIVRTAFIKIARVILQILDQ